MKPKNDVLVGYVLRGLGLLSINELLQPMKPRLYPKGVEGSRSYIHLSMLQDSEGLDT